MDIWSLALSNLLSIPILCFVLGLIATRIKSDVRIPDSVMKFLTFYLLLAIGIKGGVSLREAEIAQLAWPVVATNALGITLPILAFAALRAMTRLDRIDRGAIAAHYGSTSLVTFTAALVFLEAADVFVEGYVVTLLAIMEIPGIVVGLMLASSRGRQGSELLASAREVLTSPSNVLLVGGVVIGALAGPTRFLAVEPFFGDLFVGVLSFFLLQMGITVASRFGSFIQAGPGLAVFAVSFPLVAGLAGVLAGTAAGLGAGGATMLGVLSASASYIAAPAAVRLALPHANEGLAITCSLAMTFPVNMVIGIPLIAFLGSALAS
ncbi:MAG: sodium-dependent bicarbonate transport family permease [Candidatus Nanopelagicales bacterium]